MSVVVVHKYGLLDPIDWGQDCQEQLYRMNRFWNALVELDRANRQAYENLVGEDPQVAALKAQQSALEAERDGLIEQRNQARAATRSKAAAKDPVRDARIKEFKPLIDALRKQVAQAKAAAKARATEPLKALNATFAQKVKEAREANELWWCNSEAVEGAYDVARSKAMKERAQLQFHRFEGEGRFTVRFTGQGILPSQLFDGKRQVFIDQTEQPVPGRKPGTVRGGKPRPRLSVVIYTGRNDEGRFERRLSFPLILDRPLPPDRIEGTLDPSEFTDLAEAKEAAKDKVLKQAAKRGGDLMTDAETERALQEVEARYEGIDPHQVRVKFITVTRTRVATKWRYNVSITMRVPKLAGSAVNRNPKTLAVNLGWRRRPEGDLLVASCWDGQQLKREELPAEWMARMDHVEALQQRRDLALNEVATALRAEWPKRPQGSGPEGIEERLGNLVRAPKFGAGKLAGIIHSWRAAGADWWPQMLERLEAWRRLDKRDYETQENAREHLIASRKAFYQGLARRWAHAYGTVRIGKIDLKDAVRVNRADGEDNPLPKAARDNRKRAALYSLKQELKLQAAKTATAVIEVDGAYSATCHKCSAAVEVTEDVFCSCQTCGALLDQDENAVRNIFGWQAPAPEPQRRAA